MASKRAMIISDDVVSRTILNVFLSNMGYLTHTADDGRAVLPTITAMSFDIFFTDLLMPHLDGFGTLQAIKA